VVCCSSVRVFVLVGRRQVTVVKMMQDPAVSVHTRFLLCTYLYLVLFFLNTFLVDYWCCTSTCICTIKLPSLTVGMGYDWTET